MTKDTELENKNVELNEINIKIIIYKNILNKIKLIVEKINLDKNNINILEEEKKKIVLEVEKLNGELSEKNPD